jgi:hypothetical protein
MEVVQTLAFATPDSFPGRIDARLLTPTACCTPAAVDFRSRPIPNSHSHARLAVDAPMVWQVGARNCSRRPVWVGR